VLPYSRVTVPREATVGLRDKNCVDCQQVFQPRSGAQKRCDQCRAMVVVPLPEPDPTRDARDKECPDCGKMFKPSANAQKKCNDCRSIVVTAVNKKPCEICGQMFAPVTRQKWCDDCRTDDSIDRCDCGSRISGRARWGDQWGGGCDRAEEITDRLMKSLSTRSSR
jgi:hypothetical protein